MELKTGGEKHYKGGPTTKPESQKILKGDRLLIEKVEADEKVVEDVSSCGNYVKLGYNWEKLSDLKVLAVVRKVLKEAK